MERKNIIEDLENVSYDLDALTIKETITFCKELQDKYGAKYLKLYFEYETEYSYGEERMIMMLKGKRSETDKELKTRLLSEQDADSVRKENRRAKWEELSKEFMEESNE